MSHKSRSLVGATLLAAVLAIPPLSAQGAEPDCSGTARAAARAGGDPACPGVRPGAAAFNAKDGNKCTIGFLLRGSDGGRYAFVGHPCAPGKRESNVKIGTSHDERVWTRGKGPKIADSSGKVVGALVYDINQFEPQRHLDVALMRIERGVTYSPKVCQFGGPSGVNKVINNEPTYVQAYGQGDQFIVGDGPHAQEVLVPGGLNNRFKVNALTESEQPNAGGPVLSGDGMPALGIMSMWNETHGGDPGNAEGVGIFRLDPLLELLQGRLRIKLTLIKAGER